MDKPLSLTNPGPNYYTLGGYGRFNYVSHKKQLTVSALFMHRRGKYPEWIVLYKWVLYFYMHIYYQIIYYYYNHYHYRYDVTTLSV